MVCPAHGGKRHFCPSGAHRDAQRGGDPAVRRWVRVADDKTLSFQDDGFRVVLAEGGSNAASEDECQSQHGTGSGTAHGHHGRITDPVRTNRQPLGGLLSHSIHGSRLTPYPLRLFLSLPLSVVLSHSLKHPLTHRRTQSRCYCPPSCAV